MNFNRQNRLFNPKESNLNILIIGAGSTGSFVAFTLAKMGIENIKVVDYDKIEEHNLPNQYYRVKDIGKFKVDALKEIIKDFSDVEIDIENTKIDKDYSFEVDMNTIVINCVDNIESRKIMAESLKGFPVKIIDTRFGGEGYSIHYYNSGEEKEVEDYLKGLDLKIQKTSCGEKAIIYTINSIASEICNMVKKINNKEIFPALLRREMKTYRFINKKYEIGESEE